MEVPPWEFISGVKDVTFVLTYIWFIIENGLLNRICGWFYYVFMKPSFHMIVDDRYNRWDRCDRWNIRSLWLSQLLKFDFHIVAGIVQIAGHIRLLWSPRSLHSLCYGFHMIVTIAAVAALVVSINFLRSLTIDHDQRDRLWFYPSDRDHCDRWQLLGSLAIAGKVETRLKRQTPSVQAQNTLAYWQWLPSYPRRPWKSRKLLFQNPNTDHRNWAKINTSLHCSKFAVVHHVVYSLWVGWCLFKSGTLPLTLQKFIKIV